MGKFSLYILLLAATTVFISCAGNKHATRQTTSDYSTTVVLNKKHMGPLLDFAAKQLKVPYQWGGSTPKGFDCSGFSSYCYAHFGVPLPRTASDQSLSGKRIRSRKAKAGDLIFFRGENRKQKKVAHVGIVISGKKKDIRFIHAGSRGVTVSILSEDYFSKRFITIRRIRK